MLGASKLNKCVAISITILTFWSVWVIYYNTSEEDRTNSLRSITTYNSIRQSLCLNQQKKLINFEKNVYNCPENGIVTVVQGGRLCNQIWEYAAVWAVSKVTGLKPFVPKCIKDFIDPMFESLSLPTFDEISDCPLKPNGFVRSLNDWDKHKSIILPIWSTEVNNVLKFVQEINNEFKIRQYWLDKSQKELKLSLALTNITDATIVGVHVRRTDYVMYIKNKYKATPADVDFYSRAMKFFEDKYSKVLFIMVSDEPQWCWNNFGNKSNVYVTGRREMNSPEMDLAILSSCNHTIIDYGTFGAWGAIMAGGDTIYYNTTNSPTYLTSAIAKVLKNWYTV